MGTDSADSLLAVNRQCLEGESCENPPDSASGGETSEQVTAAGSEKAEGQQVLSTSAFGNKKATAASGGMRAEGTGLEPATPYGAPHFQ